MIKIHLLGWQAQDQCLKILSSDEDSLGCEQVTWETTYIITTPKGNNIEILVSDEQESLNSQENKIFRDSYTDL